MKKVLYARYVRGVIQAWMALALPCAITISAVGTCSASGRVCRIGRDRRHRRKARVDRAGNADRDDGLERGRSHRQNITSIQDLVGAIPVSPCARRVRARPSTRCAAWPPPALRATVGFYIDETPLSASAVALNGRRSSTPTSTISIARRSCVGRRALYTEPIHGRHYQVGHQSAQTS